MRMNCKRDRSRFLGVALFLVIVTSLVMGQGVKPAEKVVSGHRAGQRPAAAATPKPSPSPAPVMPAVTLVSASQPEYMSGEANVTVKGNQNPIIRLGLAQNGVNVIEFPLPIHFS